MKRMVAVALLALAVALAWNAEAGAMSSPSYRVDWMVPLSGGGGQAASANYKIGVTIGQAVSGGVAAGQPGACFGFWCGVMTELRQYLPLVAR